MSNLGLLAVVTRDIVEFLAALRLSRSSQQEVCVSLLAATKNGELGNTDYELLWLSNFFYNVVSPSPQNREPLLEFRREFATNRHVEREFLAGCRRHAYSFAVKNLKSDFRALSPWSRRALLHASSCLSQAERRAWAKGIRSDLDVLEKAVLDGGEFS